MESYTPTRLYFRSSLIKSHNSLFYLIQYFIPLSSFRAYRLGQSIVLSNNIKKIVVFLTAESSNSSIWLNIR